MGDKFDQFSTIELKGAFWIPETPEVKLNGILYFNFSTGPSLELFGSFDQAGKDKLRWPVIHGIAQGQAVTLFKCFKQGGTINIGIHGQTSVSKFDAIYLFLGAMLIPEESLFSECNFNFTALEEWLFKQPFNTIGLGTPNANVGYTPAPTVEVQVPTLNAKVAFRHRPVFHVGTFTKLLWETKSFVSITPDSPQKVFDYYWDTIRNLRNLFTLMIGEPVFPASIVMKLDGAEVHLFYKEPELKAHTISNVQMMTLFPRIQNKWEEILGNWFAKTEVLSSTTTLLFGTMITPMNVEMQFLCLSQALESYHRNVKGGSYLSEDEYKAQIYEPMAKAIPNAASLSLRQSLKAKVKYGNELSLRKRLNSLLADLPQEVMKLIKADKWNDLVETLVTKRNALTHHTAELNQLKASALDLWELGKAMETILVFLLFHEIGLMDSSMIMRLSSKYYILFNQPE
ncbi:MAG: HEPN domain-containing protein [Verrucomicrobiales bacterium]